MFLATLKQQWRENKNKKGRREDELSASWEVPRQYRPIRDGSRRPSASPNYELHQKGLSNLLSVERVLPPRLKLGDGSTGEGLIAGSSASHCTWRF